MEQNFHVIKNTIKNFHNWLKIKILKINLKVIYDKISMKLKYNMLRYKIFCREKMVIKFNSKSYSKNSCSTFNFCWIIKRNQKERIKKISTSLVNFLLYITRILIILNNLKKVFKPFLVIKIIHSKPVILKMPKTHLNPKKVMKMKNNQREKSQ